MRRHASTLLLAVLGLLVAGVVAALGLLLKSSQAGAVPTCTINWTGSTNSYWNTASNWDLGRLPKATDEVCMSASPARTSINIASGNTANAGGINFPSSGSITDAGALELGANGSSIASLDVQGTLQINAAGPVSVLSFTLDGSGGGQGLTGSGTKSTLTVTGNGSLINNPFIGNGISFVIAGKAQLGSQSTLYMSNSSTIEVASGGTFAVSDGSDLYNNDGTANSVVVDSKGVLQYSSSVSGATSDVDVPLTMNGTASVTRGTLSINSGGSLGASASATTSAGGVFLINSQLNEPSGQTGDIAGFTLDSGATYGGPGKYVIPSGRSSTFDGGNLNGTTVTNNGTLVIEPKNTLYFNNSSVVDNFGTVLFNDSSSFYDNDSTKNLLRNEPTGTLSYQASSSSASAQIQVPLDDNGTANVSVGTLSIESASTVGPDQKVTGNGTFELDSLLSPEPGQTGVISNIVPGSGAIFSGPGKLSIPAGQSASWANGDMEAGADVVNSGTLKLASNYTLYLYNASTLDNFGTIVMSDSSDIYDSDNSGNLLLNESKGQISFNATSSAETASVELPITNFGTLSSSFGRLELTSTLTVKPSSIATSTHGGLVDVMGTVQPPPPVNGKAQTGNLGGLTLDTSSTTTGPGTLTVAKGASVSVLGGTFTGGVVVSNSGTITLMNGASPSMAATSLVKNFGSFVVQDNVTIYDSDSTGNEIVNEHGGTLTYKGSNAVQSASISPPVLNSGTLAVELGTLDLTLMSSDLPGTTSGTLTGGGSYNLSGVLDVVDTAQISGGTTSTQPSPNIAVNNAAIVLLPGGGLETSSGSTRNLVNNKGSFSTSLNLTLNGGLSSSGVLNVSKGTLVAPGGVTLAGGSSTTVSSGATLQAGTSTKPKAVTLSKPASGEAAPLLNGNGTIAGQLLNYGGKVSPAVGFAGALKVTGPYTQSASTGGAPVLSIEVNSTGTSPGTNFGQLALTGKATLAGTVALTAGTGYNPAAGTSITILKAASRTGTFAKVTGVKIGSTGKYFVVSYTATSIVVVVRAPTVTAITPGSVGQAASGLSVKITGIGFAAGDKLSSANSGVKFANVSVSSYQALTATISATASAPTGKTSVIVTPLSGSPFECASCLTITAKPAVSSLSPKAVKRGTTTTVKLLGSHFETGAKVTFSGSGVTATIVSVTSTTITVKVLVTSSAATGKRTVTVTNPDGGNGSLSNALTVTT